MKKLISQACSPAKSPITIGHPLFTDRYTENLIHINLISGVCRCRALYEYKAAQSDELDILPGDIITLTAKLDDGWWKGELHNKTGIFPASYVEEIG